VVTFPPAKHFLRWEVLTSLAYPAVGLLSGDPLWAGMMTGLGLTSAYYHAGGRNGNSWDVGMIYAVLLYLGLLVFGFPLIFAPITAVPLGWRLRVSRKLQHMKMEHKVAFLGIPPLLFGFCSGISVVSLYPAPLMSLSWATLALVAALGIRKWVNHGLWHVTSAFGLAMTHSAYIAVLGIR